MIKIVDFTIDHIEQARAIARAEYEREREQTPIPPSAEMFPDFPMFAKNGLGVAAWDQNKMIGYLCCYPPFDHAFRSTDTTGVFSPMHGNGAVTDNRDQIYARMYETAAEKWVRAGAASHAVCLYAHDQKTQKLFFQYGFGLRSIDAIRAMETPDAPEIPGLTLAELKREEAAQIWPLHIMLDRHMASSPTFLLRPSDTEEEYLKKCEREGARFFVAQKQDAIIAYIKISGSGETFICGTQDMTNICGAFCLPAYRGTGIYQNLLWYMVRILKTEGYTRLGVDFESHNPTAYGFWMKHFTAYTHSVVRRIDEHALNMR